MNRCTGAARDDDDSMYFGHSNATVVESTVSVDCVLVCCGGDGSGLGVVVVVGAATVTVGAIMLFIVVLLV